MSTVATFDAAPARTESRETPAWLSLDHAFTIFTSAFLLFQVQPLISKYILPWFGGSPAVWTTAMLFFQILLFAGYTYAHVLTNWFSPKAQGIIHGGLLLAAILTLPITPDDSWKPTGGEDPTWRILCLLAATVGLPYFVLSTTGPLVQAWFSRAFRGRSPYRLYSLSNVGSLLALVSYPFVIEPTWNTATQSQVWSGLFMLFAALCAVALVWNATFRGSPLTSVAGSASGSSGIDAAAARPTTLRRLLWVLLPALASLMLLATTNHVCQDVAVVPFLWVIPLSLYLLTFIISFDHARWYQPLLFGIATLVASLAVAGVSDLDSLIGWLTDYKPGFTFGLVLYFLFMFLACMTCHGELVRLRPDPRHLTEFYLMISAGGALGGLFVAVVAPRVFSTFFEWKIAIVASFVLGLVVTFRYGSFRIPHPTMRAAVASVFGLIGLAAIIWWQVSISVPLDRARNFFGVVSVHEIEGDTPADHTRMLRHGAIAHGRQYTTPERRHIAGSYYYSESGLGHAIAFLGDREQIRVGTIGLGVGTVATFARSGDVYRFYEINPEVVRQANTFFTFLKDCKGKTEVVLGDGRLALEREAPQNYDLLIIDAFSGDSIPMHLATLEAFEIYKKHLKPDGILAVNITNSYIDIFPMLRSMADHIHLKWTRMYIPYKDSMHYRTDWLLLTNDQQFLNTTPTVVPADRWTTHRVPLWTDHFSNLWSVLR